MYANKFTKMFEVVQTIPTMSKEITRMPHKKKNHQHHSFDSILGREEIDLNIMKFVSLVINCRIYVKSC